MPKAIRNPCGGWSQSASRCATGSLSFTRRRKSATVLNVSPDTNACWKRWLRGAEPAYRFTWSNVCEFVAPAPPPLDITSKPVLVRNIWGQYGRQKKSWAMSLALQSATVVLLITAASSKIAPQKIAQDDVILKRGTSVGCKVASHQDFTAPWAEKSSNPLW